LARPVAKIEERIPSGSPQPAVRLDGVRKEFGDVVAVDRVDLDVLEGEFFSFLRPSGSGKTTCLRIRVYFAQRLTRGTGGTVPGGARERGV
jgi:putative spermidine/putrescine transport system ATP-binding protein